MFQFRGLARYGYVFTITYTDITRYGLSHSEIRGSQAASAYSRLIAGNHVLHRLLVPRHPPCALGNFIIKPMIQCRMIHIIRVSRLPRFTSRLVTIANDCSFARCITTVFDDRERFTSLFDMYGWLRTFWQRLTTLSANCIISDVSQRLNLSSILVCIRVINYTITHFFAFWSFYVHSLNVVGAWHEASPPVTRFDRLLSHSSNVTAQLSLNFWSPRRSVNMFGVEPKSRLRRNQPCNSTFPFWMGSA